MWSYAGGIVGAALMDLTEMLMARRGLTSGVNPSLLGRWCLGLLHGRLVHADIRRAPPRPHEAGIGWAFHYLIGGGAVALLYPAFLALAGAPHPGSHLPWATSFGLLTSALPWFVLLPCFGWGYFGQQGPRSANPLAASPLSHVPYGLGLGLMLDFALAAP